MTDYSNNHMIVSSSDWTDYNDVILYQDSNYQCMTSYGCFINIPKPFNVDTEYGDECIVIRITHENEPQILIII